MPTFTNGIQITGGVTITGSSIIDVTPDINDTDWTALNSATITEPSTGTFNFSRSHASNANVAYYEFTSLTSGESYQLEFESRRTQNSSGYFITLEDSLNGTLFGSVDSVHGPGSFADTTLYATLGNSVTSLFLRVEINDQNAACEIRNITLYQT